MALTWRPMVPADLAAVEALARVLYPDHPEAPAVFAERLALAPEGCLVLAPDGLLLGYAVTHPWNGLAPPPLDTLLGALPAAATAWHIHDVALAPEARGAGHAAAVVRAVSAGRRTTLVALADAVPYWTRQGFRDAPCGDAAALASYGDGARFMARNG